MTMEQRVEAALDAFKDLRPHEKHGKHPKSERIAMAAAIAAADAVHATEITRLHAEIARKDAEIAELKEVVVAFCGPWAAQFARAAGLPDGHLHPTHYDILARCGARMVDFTRALDPQP